MRHTVVDFSLSERFLEDLGLPRIEEDIAVGSVERLDQVRRMVSGLEAVLENKKWGLKSYLLYLQHKVGTEKSNILRPD
ncbi:MAG: hypothetical protein KKE79_01670 [Actinobacteria bacterium]|nr:hypothetical protein [Actinomycetota bacterium]MCG2795095.1 hypothetical protein [Actinomycetes bacterium]MBU4240706.1 hypothetical protein [Actinomycetota bacterium]MBU4302262.1 hypothetical protein [Actinomycetota bacterium]MBU4385478.1 hypothetical protein [Actinomycetota bacterium]